MKTIKLSLLIKLLVFSVSCQKNELSQQEENAFDMDRAIAQLEALEPDSRQAALDSLWENLERNHTIPYTQDSIAYFLYRHTSAGSIHFNGDFNRWGQYQQFNNRAKRLDGTDFWYLKTTFPKDARLDYKVVINGQSWVLDAFNPQLQYSGFGPNSFIAMPTWERKSITIKDSSNSTSKGIMKDFIHDSEELHYSIAFSVYLPPHYDEMSDLPVVYFTDGHEYSDDRLGATVIILDNLINQEKIEPIIAVFVDPRNPTNPNENRRQNEYVMNDSYLAFFTNELIPFIDNQFRTNAIRAIVGTSLGGLNSSFFAAKSQKFKYIAAQSPAYWYREQIFDLIEASDLSASKWYISAGTFFDGLENAEKMKALLKRKGQYLSFRQVNEGHSWGAWRQQIDEILIDFFAKTE